MKKVLITGGSGFIGGRLVEKLVLRPDIHVRVLTRNPQYAVRLARLPVEILQGNIVDGKAVLQAAEGCDVVFHCAFGSDETPPQARAATVDGTEHVAQASMAAKVARLVHVSTISVYGNTSDGTLNENAPRRKTGNLYGDSKIEAEEIIFQHYRRDGLPVTVIQPVIVFGPYAKSWTLEPLRWLRESQVVLINGGSGFCNCVYVDDVVDAMLLAAEKDEAVGEAFLISAENPVTWREFFHALELILGIESTVFMSLEEMTSASCFSARQGQEKPLWLPPREIWSSFAAKTSVSISKAKTILGYQPQFNFEQGMTLTAQWLKENNLAPLEFRI